MSEVIALVGNPRAGSRTLALAEATAAKIAGAVPGLTHAAPVELGDLAPQLFGFGDPDVEAAKARVREAGVLVVATPTFKATYSGVLKAFCDHINAGELERVTAIPLMIGGNANHTLAPDVSLRPLLTELGARLPTKSLYVLESDLPRTDEILDAWLASEAVVIGALVNALHPA
jgi:FMN reductase